MSLKQYSEEQLKELSLIELAYELFSETKEPISFYDLVDQMATVLGVTREALLEKLPQFYTELNIDGRFVCLGENRWGLRAWYPYDQAEEEVLPVAKPKKKRKQVEEDEEFEDYDASDEDEFEEEELELDETDEDLVDDDETDEFDDEEIDEDDEDIEIDDEDLELEDEEDEELDEFEEEEER